MARHRKPDIDRIGTVAASALLDGEHYLGALEFNARYCLASPGRDALAVFATPTASAFAKALPGCLELTRLWQAQARRDTGAPLSAFLRDAITWLQRDKCVFSYTDPAQIGPTGKPHHGGVYQWTGFSKLGESRVRRSVAGEGHGRSAVVAGLLSALPHQEPRGVATARPRMDRAARQNPLRVPAGQDAGRHPHRLAALS
jgi:hypothetical protein